MVLRGRERDESESNEKRRPTKGHHRAHHTRHTRLSTLGMMPSLERLLSGLSSRLIQTSRGAARKASNRRVVSSIRLLKYSNPLISSPGNSWIVS
jgi:hypothetical protein